jgi:hypothetical protein
MPQDDMWAAQQKQQQGQGQWTGVVPQTQQQDQWANTMPIKQDQWATQPPQPPQPTKSPFMNVSTPSTNNTPIFTPISPAGTQAGIVPPPSGTTNTGVDYGNNAPIELESVSRPQTSHGKEANAQVFEMDNNWAPLQHGKK